MIDALGGSVDELNPKGYLQDHAYNRLFQVLLDDDGRARQIVELRYCQPSPPAEG